MSEFDTDTETTVLEVLVDQSPLHVMEIATIVDQHPITVDQTCARLHDRGHIYPLGRGLYTVTEDGERQIGDGCDSSV